MANSLKECSISFVVFSDGERYPMLLNAEGRPHWYLTLFPTTQIRNASQAPNTIYSALTPIRYLLAWCSNKKIDLENRFATHKLFSLQEIESLVAFLQLKKHEDLEHSEHIAPLRKGTTSCSLRSKCFKDIRH